MRPPAGIIVAIAQAVERQGGDLADVEDLIWTWERVFAASEPLADALRREGRERVPGDQEGGT